MAAVRSLRVSVKPQSGSERSESGEEESDSSESDDQEEKGGGEASEPMEVEEGELEEEEEKEDNGVGRRYENKAGAFITGIDVNSKEAIERKEKRAQRFHFCDEEKKNQKDMVLDKEMMKKAVPNLRLEALHVSGVDDMSTQEVFVYFKEYPPAHIEWIDDTSCNVVWLDDVTSSRALINCSRMPDPKVVVTETEVKASEKHPPTDSKERTEQTSDDEEEEEEGQVEAEGAESGGGEESGGGAESGEKVENREEEEEKNTDGAPPPTQVDSVSEAETDSLLENHPRPAVKPFKGNKLFLRFATHDDRKEQGASRKSRYYMKYGNPNYGGMKGILSNSWKRRYHSRRNPRDVKNKSPLIGDSLGHTPPYTHTHSADLVNLPEEPIEEEEEDEDDDDDEDDMESDDRTVEFKEKGGQRSLATASAGLRLRSRGSSSGSDSEEMDYDLELKMISTPPAPPPTKKTLKMTMYADQLSSSARSESRLAGGLRNRIGGGGDSEPTANQTAPSAVTDIRQLLEEKRHRQRLPVASTGKTDVRQRLGKRRYDDRRSSSPDTPPPREPTRDVHSRLGVASQESRGLHSDWSKDRKTSRLWSRLGPSDSQEKEKKERFTSSSSSSSSSSKLRRRKEEEPEKKKQEVVEEAEEQEQEEGEEDSRLQRMWGAMISRKQQSQQRLLLASSSPPPDAPPSSRGQQHKKSRLDQLPSLQIEISREEESSEDDN